MVSDGQNQQSKSERRSLTKWIALPGVIVGLLLAIGCWALLLYLKPEWATAFIGWWFGGVFLQRVLLEDEAADVLALTGAPAFTIGLIIAFFLVAVFFPQVLTIIVGLMVAAAIVFFLMNYFRSFL